MPRGSAHAEPALHGPLRGRPPAPRPPGDKKRASHNPLAKGATLDGVPSWRGAEITRTHGKLVVGTLVTVGHRELKKGGVFVLPGFAKFVVVKKPARPFTQGGG